MPANLKTASVNDRVVIFDAGEFYSFGTIIHAGSGGVKINLENGESYIFYRRSGRVHNFDPAHRALRAERAYQIDLQLTQTPEQVRQTYGLAVTEIQPGGGAELYDGPISRVEGAGGALREFIRDYVGSYELGDQIIIGIVNEIKFAELYPDEPINYALSCANCGSPSTMQNISINGQLFGEHAMCPRCIKLSAVDFIIEEIANRFTDAQREQFAIEPLPDLP